eukprot:TRINITY_DN7351_c0_g1_i1.p1 TRINITY_DN7351_c0_g1~~TRINITY_DN7351_c0_g1_i1.p1  ORF type:complete len:113 (-),score=25.04 TRINITY_DN7351_c0_g1_i1:542-835(-)
MNFPLYNPKRIKIPQVSPIEIENILGQPQTIVPTKEVSNLPQLPNTVAPNNIPAPTTSTPPPTKLFKNLTIEIAHLSFDPTFNKPINDSPLCPSSPT